MQNYLVRQFDSEGAVLSEVNVEAMDYTRALSGIKGVADGAQRIDVYNVEGEKAGSVGVDYWRQRLRRK